MTAPVFVVDPAVARSAAPGDSIVLDGPEGRHAVRVRRLRPGERVDVTDGCGTRCQTEVVEVTRDALSLRVLRRSVEPAPQPSLVVVQALIKGDPADEAVRVMTEVGVDVIVPWAAARSVVKWDAERAVAARRRWSDVAREASKQSRRSRFPEIAELADTAAVVDRLRTAELGVVLDGSAERGLGEVGVPAEGRIVVVVGPEGGLTEEESAAFDAAGARRARMGPTVLRAATAGAIAAAVVLSKTPRWAGITRSASPPEL
ncbi:MAG: 16S rRNA (uracil(1498)-N(3))-methyltransferase [Acidothermus sp.]|nr:16S rRNA (uracil(1498)-N(3))-methyltransferase [Acidothermus sp.]